MADVFLTDKDKRELEGKIGTKADKSHQHSAEDIGGGIIEIEHGGTGANTAEEALQNLGITRAIMVCEIPSSSSNRTFSYPEGFNKHNSFVVSLINKSTSVSSQSDGIDRQTRGGLTFKDEGIVFFTGSDTIGIMELIIERHDI